MHRTQHRPAVESPAKEAADYKRENKSLRKRVARLQKELDRMLQASNNMEEPQDEAVVIEGHVCKKCGIEGHIGTYTTPSGKTVSRCKKCHTST